MIKFFRHIRKSLIQENKMGKYFKYAVGEIILVVIGILIALQINNWNQNQIDKKNEKEIILKLIKDFRTNQTDLDSYITKIEKHSSANEKLMTLIGSTRKQLKLHNLDSLLHESMGATNIAFADNTLNNLIQTDRLGLLQNDSLIVLLNNWISLKKIRLDRVNKLDAWVNGFHLNYLSNRISFKEMDSYGKYKWSGKSKVKPDYYELFQEVKFENSLENILWYNYKIYERCIETKQLINQILKVLNSSK